MASPAFSRTSIKRGGVKGGAGMKAHYLAREDCYGPGMRKVDYLGTMTTHAVRDDWVDGEPRNLPSWAKDAADFFQAAEQYERANGVVLRELRFDLPKDLSRAAQLALTRDFVSLHLGDNHALLWAMHEPRSLSGTGTHPHVHLIWSDREVDGVDRTPQQFFRRPDVGGARKTPALNQWNAPAMEKQLYCDVANWHLEQAGVATRFHPGSHQERGLELTREPKLLPSDSYAYEHRGIITQGMQKLLDHRAKMAPHRSAEARDAQQYWEQRKARLGITERTPHELALERIAEARQRSLTTPPRRQSAYSVAQDTLSIEQSITALETYRGKLAAEAALEGAHARTGMARHPKGVARVEALLAEGPAHGVDTARPRVTQGWERPTQARPRERSPERMLPTAGRLRAALQALEHGGEDEAGRVPVSCG